MTVASALTVDGDRLIQSVIDLAAIGKLANDGVRRIAFSPEDIEARQLVQTWMTEAGMTVQIDAAGNIIGTYAGRYPGPALATGSHIDTVAVAGRYDGTLGVLAGLEVVRTLRDHHITLNRDLQVIVFTDEESSMIGSKAMSGLAKLDPDYYQRSDGSTIQTCLQAVGGDWSQLATAKISRSNIAAFVELHVEQGGLLEASGKQVGVVEGIVSLNRYIMTVEGQPNHAGTTPMDMRKDALVAAAQIVLAVDHLARTTPGQQVATVGMLTVSPNATNIVPGHVEMSLDVRDLSQAHVDYLVEQLRQQIEAIAASTQTKITITPTLRVEPTLAAPYIQQAITQVCQQLELSYINMPSRAGHDAQEIGRFTDMGMIFVPSTGGVSHAEDEYTSPEDCVHGTNVLLHSLMQIDQQLEVAERS